MIHIGLPYITEDSQFAYLRAKVVVSSDTALAYRRLEYSLPKAHWRFYEDYPPKAWENGGGELYFAVPKTYKQNLCISRSDAFVVAMVWYAIMSHSDIEYEAPLSERAYFGISQLLIPAVCRNIPPIRLIGPTTSASIHSAGAVGTGMSCGVDSLYSLKKYSDPSVPPNYRLTHLTYFNMGAIFHPDSSTNKRYGIAEFYDITDRMSLEKLENASAVAAEQDLQMLYVFSNLDKDYYRGGYGYTGVYRNCAMVLAVQELFSVYYCSSAGWPEFFDLSLNEGSEHYEALLCTAFSTENLQFVLSDYATRLEKTKALADDDTAQRHLDVCFNFNNCGKCSKCYRTLITLDAIGKVDSFRNVFDVSRYMANRASAYAWLLETMRGNEKDDNAVFARDLYKFLTEKGIQIPKRAYYLYTRKKIRSRLKRIRRKLKRCFVRLCRK